MINTAVVGAGYWGINIIRVLSELSNLKYICDLDIDTLNRKYGENKKFIDTTLTGDILDVMYDTDVEAIFIVTPPETHSSLATLSLTHGKHTFIEKPMTSSSKEAESLIKLSSKKKLKLGVGHTFLYSAPVLKVKEIIDSGELGEVLHIDMFRKNLGKFQSHCDVIYDLAPHDFSMLLFWFPGFSINRANVSLFSHFKGLQPDTSNIDILSSNNITVNLSYSWIYPFKIRDTYIIGSKKSLKYSDTDPNASVAVFDKGIERYSPSSFGDFICSYRTGDCYIPYIKIEEPLKKEIQSFLDCVEFGEDIVNDGNNGRDVVKLIEVIRKITPLETEVE